MASGLLLRHKRVLLVACRYPGEQRPLWVLPGGRQRPAESLEATVRREFVEETSLRIRPVRLAYVSESVDAALGRHVLNVTFWVLEDGTPRTPAARDRRVADIRFVPLRRARVLLEADVLRVPVAAALRAPRTTRYFFFDAAATRVPFFGRPDARGKR
jgi:ADP-ribose pyrophosphatase YjhB (NUDIX family)